MRHSSSLTKFALISLVSSSVLLSGCIIHVGSDGPEFSTIADRSSRDFTKTNKSVTVPSALNVEEVSSVNGSVTIKDRVSATQVSNVNGRVSVGNNVSVESIETVNGSIKIGSDFSSQGNIETVNGALSIKQRSTVGGSVETVNGDINLNNVEISKNITTVNGSIYLKQGSVVNGDIVFRGKPNNNKARYNPPELKIDASSVVNGNIIVYKEVEFDFADASLMDKVIKR